MEITNISSLDRTTFLNQDYNPKDETLLNALEVNSEFGNPEDKIEIHIIGPNEEIIESVYDFRNYKITNTVNGTSLFNQIELDPKADLESFGYFSGQYDINYNFYRQLFLSNLANTYFISEISSDRTEIKITNNNISYTDLGQSYLNYITTRNSRNFYSDFILNFGGNDTYIAVNVALDNVNTSTPSLYIKLYEPLPSEINIKDTLWLVESISEPYSFRVNTDFIAEDTNTTIPLKGPNINIDLNEKVNLTTPYLNLSNLLTNSSTSSYQQLQSWLEENSIEITVDYTDFSNFVHFSSAIERLENFKYKLTQIQSLQSDIEILDNLNPLANPTYINSNKIILQSKLNSLIEKFDGYEYYLYYESGSKSWPKTSSTKPYINASPTSSLALNWLGSSDENSIYYGGEILSASNYDNSNRDYIWGNLPDYIKSDSQNANLELFTSMLGQHYDYIWTYIKDITDIQVADNRIDFGISKDLVAETLKNFGIKLYTNSRNQDDIYSSLLGINAEGSFLPSTGSYLIDTYITASQYTIPDNDIVKETYKRIYHNMPYLLKTRGTKTGLRALINCFGIPETILKVREYGGSKKDENLIEQITPKFNYSIENPNIGVPFLYSQKQFLDTGENILPDTLEFRFKLDSIIPTQSLLSSQDNWKDIRVTYITGSNANIDFGLGNNTNLIYSAPIELPLYNGDWWNLNLTRETGSLNISQTGSNNTYTLTIGNKNDSGVQYLVSSSIFITGSTQSGYNRYGWNTEEDSLVCSFSGSIQEFRYWIGSISSPDFNDHILNPRSIEYNGVTGSYNNLIFRLPLGSELDIISGSTLPSVHPSPTSSFTTNFSGSKNSGDYITNNEIFLINTPNIGSITEIDEKVRITTPNLIHGDVLTPYISIQKPGNVQYTNDLSIVDIAISPQDSINEDIISQLGNFNIDEYIGDPRLASESSYPSLTELKDFYFQKYSSSQNIFDIIKLLSYFDNSLFKMIKDFVPAKTNLATGLTIKSHILERNKIAKHEPILTSVEYSGSIETAFISGSNGLNLNLNTDYTENIISDLVTFPFNHTDRRELITGELGGSEATVYYPRSRSIVYESNKLNSSSSVAIANRFSELPFIPTLNNILNARTSPKYLDVDYAYNPNIPVNINFLSASLALSLRTTAFPFLNAHVQDSNYTLKRHTQPRYEGSRLFGEKYNTYSANDISYGSDPVINLNSIKFAYFEQITSQPTTLNGRSNINVKYLIDSASNIIELTEANNNLFDVQDIFNKTNVNIALDNVKTPSNQKSLNGLKPIYAGGFRYEPILLNYSTETSDQTQLNFLFQNDIEIENPDPGAQVTAPIAGGLTVSGFSLGTSPTLTINTNSSTLNFNIDSSIKASVNRITPYAGEIRQKIIGSVQFKVTVYPNNDFVTEFYNNYTGTGTPFHTRIGTYENTWLPVYNPNDPLSGPTGLVNKVGAIRIEPGVKVSFANAYDLNMSSATYNSFTSGYPTNSNFNGTAVNGLVRTENATIRRLPLIIDGNGIDRIKIESISDTTSLLYNKTQIQNPLGSTPTTNLSVGSSHNVLDTGLELIINFPIEALLVLPSGELTGNIELKALNNQPGNIKIFNTFTITSTSKTIRFEEQPINDFGLVPSGTPYYLTAAPGTIYITGSSDNGFNSGSSLLNNWYFERGNKVVSGSVNTLLTASYDLSTLYYNYISNPISSPNYFIQTLISQSLVPTGSFTQPTEYYIPKIGDLIKFFNHDKNTFPFSPSFERELIGIYPPQSLPIGSGSDGTGSYDNRLVFEVSGENIPNQACIPSSVDGIGKIANIIHLSKIPDETNIIINYEKNPGETSPGILFTEDINLDLKDKAGNIIKGLKSQNLI